MSTLADFQTMLSPQGLVQIDIEVTFTGLPSVTYSRIQAYNSIGVDVTEAAADIFDAFSVYDDGTDQGTTIITLTGLADIMPMRWEWSYDEEEISSPGTFHTINETWDFDGVSATRTFSASATNRKSTKGTQPFTITAFTCPA